MTTIKESDLSRRAFKANPYPFYARLRDQTPVCRIQLCDKRPGWLVTRYDDVVTVLKDDRFKSEGRKVMTPEQLSRQPWVPKAFTPLLRNMLALDPPDHTRLRALVHKAFTPRLVEAMRQGIERLTDELLDAARARGRIDLIHDYALPLPTMIIAGMLGVPARDRPRFHRWSSAIMTSTSSIWSTLKILPHVSAFMNYLRKLVNARRVDPQDDLTSALVQAREAGDSLSEDELLAMIFLLLVAGHETTVNLIGNGVLALLEHPAQMARLRDDPELIKPAVEELLRFDAPVQIANERYASEDVTIAGVTIARGEMVFPVLASANRDPAQFDRPDELEIAREPNRHLTFGQGIHYCVGAPLARLEGQIAINTLLSQMPDLRLAVPKEALRRRPGMSLHGLERLPLAFRESRARLVQAASRT
jgi:cytochrome P450